MGNKDTTEISVNVKTGAWHFGALFTYGIVLAVIFRGEYSIRWWEFVLGAIVIYAGWPLVLGLIVGGILVSAGF